MKFKARLWKSGDSYVVTIPKAFVEHGAVSSEKELEFEIKEGE